MNKILHNFLVVGIALATIQAASAGKQKRDDLGERKVNTTPLSLKKIEKLRFPAPHKMKSSVREYELKFKKLPVLNYDVVTGDKRLDKLVAPIKKTAKIIEAFKIYQALHRK